MFFSPSDKQINHFYLSCPVQDGPALRRRTPHAFWGCSGMLYRVVSQYFLSADPCLLPVVVVKAWTYRACGHTELLVRGDLSPSGGSNSERWPDLLMPCPALKASQRCTQTSEEVLQLAGNFCQQTSSDKYPRRLAATRYLKLKGGTLANGFLGRCPLHVTAQVRCQGNSMDSQAIATPGK